MSRTPLDATPPRTKREYFHAPPPPPLPLSYYFPRYSICVGVRRRSKNFVRTRKTYKTQSMQGRPPGLCTPGRNTFVQPIHTPVVFNHCPLTCRSNSCPRGKVTPCDHFTDPSLRYNTPNPQRPTWMPTANPFL